MSARRPNVILVLADQWRPDALSVYGHPEVRTPHLDALAAEGVAFRNVVTQSPLCVPARSCFFTGRYVHQTGIADNGAHLWPESPNFVRAVRDAGYETLQRGKLHLFWRHDNELPMSDHLLQRFGFCDAVETTGKCSEGRLRASAYTEHLRRQGMLAEFFRDLWKRTRSRPNAVSYGPSILRDDDDHIDAWILERGREAIRSRKPDDAPYFLWLGPPGPHDPFDPPNAWARMYAPETLSAGLRRFSTDPASRQRAERLRVRESGDDEIRRLRALYYGNVSFIDHKIGQLVADLRAAGQYDDTWLIVTADHGEMLGDFHLTTKSVFHRAADQVPLVIKTPRGLAGAPRGKLSDALVELIDVATTIREIAGGALDGDQGRSLLPLLRGETPLNAHREDAHSQVDGRCMVRTRECKLLFTNWEAPEPTCFYDLEQDPQELNNVLAERPAEVRAFIERHVRPFYERTQERLGAPWVDARPFKAWGRYVLGELFDEA
ncbi:MAG: sulfatase-like hydrolase/transferase [Planctomycetota bacterium]|nr:sulfatase-like hydrolase/transferase [Planctomycetota bacterium]